MRYLLILSFSLLTFLGGQLNAQDITGDWNGALEIQGMTLRVIFHITEEDGKFVSVMDSPDQEAFGIATDETIFEGNELTISAQSLAMRLVGTYDSERNIIEATFNQGPMSLPLELTREEIEEPVVIRPQEPTVFDYTQEEVRFTNPDGGHELAGTLTIPKSGNFEKVAILVSGSGPQNRDEELLGHRPFLVLSDHLTNNGIAVLRYDDRGVGESGGNFQEATSEDLAKDAESALAYLRSRKDMNSKKMGIVGHSEGGLIAPVVASRKELDYIVLLAGPGTALDSLLEDQSIAISRASGTTEEQIQQNVSTSMKVFKYVKANPELSQEEIEKGVRRILEIEFENLSEEARAELGDLDVVISQQAESVTSPWFRYFLNFSPSDYLTKVKCPVLAVNGELDLQVLPKQNLKKIAQYLAEAGNMNFTIRELPQLNHLFQKAETGSPSNYARIEETFNESALEIVSEWINNYDKASN